MIPARDCSPQEVRAPAGELIPASGCLPEAAGGVRGVGRAPEASLQHRGGVALEALCLLFSRVDFFFPLSCVRRWQRSFL